MKQVVHFDGVPVGILVPIADCFKFIAVKFHVYDLDGQHFRSAGDVVKAIFELNNRVEKAA
jgi:hypothetical protein